MVALVACAFIPVPFLDTVAQNVVRRIWAGWHARRYGPTPGLVTDQPLAPVKRILLRPVKALVKKTFPPIVLWDVWKLIRETRKLGDQIAAGCVGLPVAVEAAVRG
jgi:hypothetical protein